MRILYFAWMRARIGKAGEEFILTPEIKTVGDLVALLKDRGGGYALALADPTTLKAAINHDYVPLDHPLKEGDELALFPPVTGG